MVKGKPRARHSVRGHKKGDGTNVKPHVKGKGPSRKRKTVGTKQVGSSLEFSSRFPTTTFSRDPGSEYIIEPSRKLFGEQRYGLAKFKPKPGVVDRKNDYPTKAEAEAALNSLNLYADLWNVFNKGDMPRIRNMALIVTGDKPEDQIGLSDRSIFGRLTHNKPKQVYQAYNKTK